MADSPAVINGHQVGDQHEGVGQHAGKELQGRAGLVGSGPRRDLPDFPPRRENKPQKIPREPPGGSSLPQPPRGARLRGGKAKAVSPPAHGITHLLHRAFLPLRADPSGARGSARLCSPDQQPQDRRDYRNTPFPRGKRIQFSSPSPQGDSITHARTHARRLYSLQ